MAILNAAEAPSWSKFVTDFDATNRLFNDNFRGLIAMGSYVSTKHPELQPEYNKMVSDARGHKATLDKLASIKSTVSGWLQSLGGFFTPPSGSWGVTDTLTIYDEDEDGLGIIPVLWPVATALSALAVIGYWIKDAFQFSRRLNELQRLEGTGMTPQAAAAVVDKTIGTSGGGIFGVNIKWLVVGGLLIVFGPMVFRMLKARR